MVDLWAGLARPDGQPWERDTIVNVYSSTKTMAALCVLMLADRGKLDLDAPVATYWPEFAQNGKGGVLVSHVMAHSAGLPGFDPPLEVADLYDWKKVCDNLAAQAPWWDPGTAVAYHAITQGYLQGELVRRVDGRTLGTFFRDEVAGRWMPTFTSASMPRKITASLSLCHRRSCLMKRSSTCLARLRPAYSPAPGSTARSPVRGPGGLPRSLRGTATATPVR